MCKNNVHEVRASDRIVIKATIKSIINAANAISMTNSLLRRLNLELETIEDENSLAYYQKKCSVLETGNKLIEAQNSLQIIEDKLFEIISNIIREERESRVRNKKSSNCH